MQPLKLDHLSSGEQRALSQAAAIKQRINRIFCRWCQDDESRDRLRACKRLRDINARKWDLQTGHTFSDIARADHWAKSLTFRQLHNLSQ